MQLLSHNNCDIFHQNFTHSLSQLLWNRFRKIMQLLSHNNCNVFIKISHTHCNNYYGIGFVKRYRWCPIIIVTFLSKFHCNNYYETGFVKLCCCCPIVIVTFSSKFHTIIVTIIMKQVSKTDAGGVP